MIVKVDTLEQAKRRFLVVRETCAAGATTRWRCVTCGWNSARDTTQPPEEHACTGIRFGVPRPGRRFGVEV